MLQRIKKRLRALVRLREVEREIDEELHRHLERQVDINLGRGMAPGEARYAALRAFGGVEQAKEECRESRGIGVLENLSQDVRYGVRMLLKTPAFTLIAILTLALGIGVNTAIFSVINAVLLSPLPYPEADKLVFLSERSPQTERLFVSWMNYLDWRAQNRVFEHIGVFRRESYNLTSAGEPERLGAGQVSADLFSVLRVSAELGRVFTTDEDQPNAPPVVVLSHALWERTFNGDPGILNKTIRLNDRGYTVLGVMPAAFQFPARADLWVPAGQLSGGEWRNRDNHPALFAVGRLKPGVSIEQARSEMDGLALGLEERYPDTNRRIGIAIAPLKETIVGDVRLALWVLFAAAAFVLLIACVNVAHLLLTRAAVRQREMTIRAALGASRARLVRQLLTESLVLALLGGGAGWMLARWSLRALIALSTGSVPRGNEIRLDGRVLAFTAGASLLTGLMFGLAPAWRAGSVSIQGALKDAGHTLSGGKWRMRSALLITEIALPLVLIIGAGLLLRSFYQINQVNPGFAPDHLLSFSLSLPAGKYLTPGQRNNFYGGLTQRLGGLPGVQSVGLASGLPFGNSTWRMGYIVDGAPIPPQNDVPMMDACMVSPDYFRTMGIPLRAGRFFTEQDNRQHLAGRDLDAANEGAQGVAGLNVIIIDEEFASRYWPKEDPIGKRIRLSPVGPNSPVLTVIGVVGRVKMDRLNVDSKGIQAYFSSLQFPFPNMTVLIKSRMDPAQLIAAARRQVQVMDPVQPIYNIKTMEQLRGDSMAPERLNATLLSLFASLALVLATVGVYGLISYAVTQRTREIGIRLALGARRADVLNLVVRQGMKFVLSGLAIGMLGAFALTRFLKSLLFAVSPTDPVTFAGVTGLVVAVAFLACYLPARRATTVNPLIALRHD